MYFPPSGFFSQFRNKKSSSDQDIEEGGFWRRRPLWLKDMYGGKKHEKGEPATEEELFLKMEQSKSSPSSTRIDASDSAAETGGESTS
ncbi:hypothetical protein QTO34_009256 [Cnephaeus nilssonii]|uniref:Uncharacterized protein n=1 Tax=Cnephaeus nilssonii TaxID=3371016 RepID=A0AA40LGS9_CNENI|nr:hypothetical protein QTO34_009256 [Eptesicus nilssonii]